MQLQILLEWHSKSIHSPCSATLGHALPSDSGCCQYEITINRNALKLTNEAEIIHILWLVKEGRLTQNLLEAPISTLLFNESGWQ